MNKKVIRDYEKYWILLKSSPMNHKYAAKILTVKVPESLVSRMKRMISKEKNVDFIFTNENYFNPWKLSFKIVESFPGTLPGHGVCVLRITLDRKTDL